MNVPLRRWVDGHGRAIRSSSARTSARDTRGSRGGVGAWLTRGGGAGVTGGGVGARCSTRTAFGESSLHPSAHSGSATSGHSRRRAVTRSQCPTAGNRSSPARGRGGRYGFGFLTVSGVFVVRLTAPLES